MFAGKKAKDLEAALEQAHRDLQAAQRDKQELQERLAGHEQSAAQRVKAAEQAAEQAQAQAQQVQQEAQQAREEAQANADKVAQMAQQHEEEAALWRAAVQEGEEAAAKVAQLLLDKETVHAEMDGLRMRAEALEADKQAKLAEMESKVAELTQGLAQATKEAEEARSAAERAEVLQRSAEKGPAMLAALDKGSFRSSRLSVSTANSARGASPARSESERGIAASPLSASHVPSERKSPKSKNGSKKKNGSKSPKKPKGPKRPKGPKKGMPAPPPKTSKSLSEAKGDEEAPAVEQEQEQEQEHKYENEHELDNTAAVKDSNDIGAEAVADGSDDGLFSFEGADGGSDGGPGLPSFGQTSASLFNFDMGETLGEGAMGEALGEGNVGEEALGEGNMEEVPTDTAFDMPADEETVDFGGEAEAEREEKGDQAGSEDSFALPDDAEQAPPARRAKKRQTEVVERTKILRAELAGARGALDAKQATIDELEATLQEKMKELVDQGEKNYQLYEQVQSLRRKLGGAHSADDEDMRGLVIRAITGGKVGAEEYRNVSNAELLRVLSSAKGIAARLPLRAAAVANEARHVARARGGHDGSGAGDAESDNELGGASELSMHEEGSLTLLSHSAGLELQAENRFLKQSNKRLLGKIEEMEEIERAGQAALESVDHLHRRGENLASRLRREKAMRDKTDGELQKSNERIKALTKHIEKLMIHLKHEVAAKNIAANEVKAYKKESALLRQRNNALAGKNKSKERMLNELREGSRILEDQLRLMDQKYVQLRTKLDWTRATSNREVKRIQQEANKLRTSFALAYSQVSHGGGVSGGTAGSGSLGPNMPGLLHGDSDSDSEAETDEDSDDDQDQAVEGEEKGAEPAKEVPRDESQRGSARLKAGKQRSDIAQQESSTTPLDGGNNSHASEAGDAAALPAIESIIPQGSERYEVRR